MKDLPKTWVSSKNRLKISDQKQSKIPVFARRTKQRKHKTPKAKTEHELVARKKETEAKLKKAFRLKLLEVCKTRIKKSCRDMVNFYLVSVACHMVTDNDSSTTFRSKFKAASLKTNT